MIDLPVVVIILMTLLLAAVSIVTGIFAFFICITAVEHMLSKVLGDTEDLE